MKFKVGDLLTHQKGREPAYKVVKVSIHEYHLEDLTHGKYRLINPSVGIVDACLLLSIPEFVLNSPLYKALQED